MEISRTRRSSLVSALCVLQTSGRRNVYLGPHLCFRLEERQEGVFQIQCFILNGWLQHFCITKICFLVSPRQEVCFDKRAYKCCQTCFSTTPRKSIYLHLSHPSSISLCKNLSLSCWNSMFGLILVLLWSECCTCTSRLVWVINKKKKWGCLLKILSGVL